MSALTIDEVVQIDDATVRSPPALLGRPASSLLTLLSLASPPSTAPRLDERNLPPHLAYSTPLSPNYKGTGTSSLRSPRSFRRTPDLLYHLVPNPPCLPSRPQHPRLLPRGSQDPQGQLHTALQRRSSAVFLASQQVVRCQERQGSFSPSNVSRGNGSSSRNPVQDKTEDIKQ
ncbi:hypothetical protein SMACR_02063 [Sordaria macrospora]|uniref:WGS project CABT00000000 data, contig 2.18 n=2 Tax=Sordaria macrospora TaxID=5147 RepID=F7W0V3_SORMK|nr:uncharacterized protein SMAC_02063 [Sordaria macrospora k-hell]KAA8632939.1 hypothetical protein SMACR_02063 [Sordaria macrospora]WPJ63858.1 hypothetical protein SMAC4_02063 [Sordaria macrospora]CCC11405.1 unnamed protein product [Sordaria macrospora k-hell]